MPSIFLPDINKIIAEVSKFDELDKKINDFYVSMGQTVSKSNTKLETVVIFDMVESTLLKLKIGHAEAMRKILLHDKICREVVKKLEGEILKETGDGLIVLFQNPLHACIAAINVVEIAVRKEVSTKASLVLGMFEKIKISNKMDVYGASMDLCSRIEKYASENQILINKTLHDTVLTFLNSYDDVLIADPISVELKGYGKTEIHEISTKQRGLKNYIKIPLQNISHEPLSLDEKIQLIKSAKFEIIDVGTGLQDLSTHFGDPSEFMGFVRELSRKGINLKLIIVDQDWSLEKLKTLDESAWQDFTISKKHFDLLKKLEKDINTEKLPGCLEILQYKKLPTFRALFIDPNQDGRIIISNQLLGLEKHRIPEIQISKTSHPQMINSYMSSIKFLLADV
jgi:class 3 adenylate cyclase